MNYSFYDFLTLLGSLGMFLYGMKIMSEGLQKAAGDRMRSILGAMTKNRVMGVLTGMMITALIQSSSATTVMVVSFVNAGLLNLAQSITVIMGANIGTTVTAWIISLFGFKFSISIIALPLIGLALPFVFSKHSRRHSIGEFMVGFALLFMGLDFLKNAVPDIKGNPEILQFLQDYTNMGMGSTLLFLLIGTIVTIIVQSSSATMAITLIMCSKGWISFDIAAAMVLGENIGTTITANLAALTANVSAKRAAFAHFLFNVFGVIWVLILFKPFLGLVEWILSNMGVGNPEDFKVLVAGMDSSTQNLIDSKQTLTDPAMIALRQQYLSGQVAVSFALSMFHTTFNICNTFIMIWFVKLYVKVVSLVIKQKSTDEEFSLQYISTGMLSTSEIAIHQSRKEIIAYVGRTRRMFGMVKDLIHEKPESESFVKLFSRIEKYEKISDRMEVEIANYLNEVASGELSATSKIQVQRKLNAVTEVESIADSCFHIARTIKYRNSAKINYTPELEANIQKMFSLIDQILEKLQELWNNDFKWEEVDHLHNMETEINHLRGMLRRQNLEDINNKVYPYTVGANYMDVITECEKLGDYVVNVVEAMTEKREKLDKR